MQDGHGNFIADGDLVAIKDVDENALLLEYSFVYTF